MNVTISQRAIEKMPEPVRRALETTGGDNGRATVTLSAAAEAIYRVRRGLPITAEQWELLPAWLKHRTPRPGQVRPPILRMADERRPICQKCERYRGDAGKTGIHCGCKGSRPCSNVVRLDGECPEKKWGEIPTWASNIGRVPDAPPADVVDFPVDLVVLWVDGADPAWQATVREYVKGNGGSRFVDVGELRYLLRSVARFATWIRRVYIVTADQMPKLEDLGLDVRVVSHREILDAKYLPTFCSSTIEAGVHNIPDLAEHFLLANDDTMFGAPVQPGHFFTPDGRAKLVFGGAMRTSGGATQMRKNAADTLDEMFQPHKWRNGWHQIQPVRKSALAELVKRLQDRFDVWMSQRTRTKQAVALNAALWPEYMLNTGYGVEVRGGARLRAKYIRAADLGDRQRANQIIIDMPHLICINNSVPADAERVKAFGDAYWPLVSAKPQTYSTFGKFGDTIYSLAAIRKAGGGELVWLPGRFYRRAEHQHATMKRFLDAQQYIHRSRCAQRPEGVYIDDARKRRKPALLGDWLARGVGAMPNWHEPWLSVPNPRRVASVVFVRCPRYHNDNFPWRHVVQLMARDAVFLGLREEWIDFCTRFGQVRYLPTSDLLDAAEVIAGADLVVSNQSSLFATAVGLGKRTVLEVWPRRPDCNFGRPGCPEIWDASEDSLLAIRRVAEETLGANAQSRTTSITEILPELSS